MRLKPQQFFDPRRWLLGLNVMSLDAPIVALVWQDFFAVNFGLKLTPAYRLLLALSAWLAYSADRWLDGFKIPPDGAVTARHAFAQQHRHLLGSMWLAVFIFAAIAASRWLNWELFERGIALLILVGIYFVINQWRRTTRWLRGVKEAIIAVTFAAASVGWILPSHRLLSSVMLWAIAGWALLCFLNCFAIAGWELDQDRAHQQESLVTRWPFLSKHFTAAAAGLLIYALLPMLIEPEMFPWHIGLALAASALLLGLLNRASTPRRVRRELLPVLADMALLTPLFFKLSSYVFILAI